MKMKCNEMYINYYGIAILNVTDKNSIIGKHKEKLFIINCSNLYEWNNKWQIISPNKPYFFFDTIKNKIWYINKINKLLCCCWVDV